MVVVNRRVTDEAQVVIQCNRSKKVRGETPLIKTSLLVRLVIWGLECDTYDRLEKQVQQEIMNLIQTGEICQVELRCTPRYAPTSLCAHGIAPKNQARNTPDNNMKMRNS